jgi:hypothetical protein
MEFATRSDAAAAGQAECRLSGTEGDAADHAPDEQDFANAQRDLMQVWFPTG